MNRTELIQLGKEVNAGIIKSESTVSDELVIKAIRKFCENMSDSRKEKLSPFAVEKLAELGIEIVSKKKTTSGDGGESCFGNFYKKSKECKRCADRVKCRSGKEDKGMSKKTNAGSGELQCSHVKNVMKAISKWKTSDGKEFQFGKETVTLVNGLGRDQEVPKEAVDITSALQDVIGLEGLESRSTIRSFLTITEDDTLTVSDGEKKAVEKKTEKKASKPTKSKAEKKAPKKKASGKRKGVVRGMKRK